MTTLVDNMRHIHRLLQNANNSPISFAEMLQILGNAIDCNCYLIDNNANLLQHYWLPRFNKEIHSSKKCSILEKIRSSKKFNEDYIYDLNMFPESISNILQSSHNCIFQEDQFCPYNNLLNMVIPIKNSNERLGTLISIKFESSFNNEDLVLAEYVANVIGLEISRSANRYEEQEERKAEAMRIVLQSLSYSELKAIRQIVVELNGKQGLIVASRVADNLGITRSVIVNALRKFESAGIIESKSLGMKGTYLKINNDKLIEELDKYRPY